MNEFNKEAVRPFISLTRQIFKANYNIIPIFAIVVPNSLEKTIELLQNEIHEDHKNFMKATKKI